MNKNSIYISLGVVALIIAAAMYIIGGNNGHLTELRDTFWIPIPLGIILIALGFKEK